MLATPSEGTQVKLFNVIDTRNSNKLGPFSQSEARTLADDLNNFVLRNASITTKPFVVKEAK